MEIQGIIAQLKEKFGDSFDVSKVTGALQKIDLKNISLPEIVSKLHAEGLLDKVGMDGLKNNVVDDLKSKAANMFGGMFGK